jgi:hypothetical protein
MTTPDLTDAYVKLDRARDHIADIESQIVSFLATDFYRMRLEADQGAGRMKIVFDSLHQPDKRINALIGDAVGNIRSTLDYLTVAFTYPLTGKADGIGFPFANDANGFAGEVRAGRCFGPCDAAVQDFFITEVQAYKRGNGHTFWVLNKLRNIDKHRLLVATVSIASVIASFRDRNQNTYRDMRFGVTAGQSGTLIDAPIGHIEFTDQPRPAFEVRLQEAGVIEDVPVLKFLYEGAATTKRLLDVVETRF